MEWKMNLKYPATFTREATGGYTVTFIDVPEAITQGDDEAEALLRAADALETALSFYVDEGQDLPRPSEARRGERMVTPTALTSAKLAIYQTMRDQGIRKSDLARRMGWHMPQVDRLLDLDHASRLEHVEAALGALGKRIEVSVV
jgi:antitoxin HicB